jgi:hypothetical protein
MSEGTACKSAEPVFAVPLFDPIADTRRAISVTVIPSRRSSANRARIAQAILPLSLPTW